MQDSPPHTILSRVQTFLRRPWHGRRADALAVGLYILITVAVTYPTVFMPGRVFYGHGGNIWWNSWMIWWHKYSLLNGLDYGFLALTQAPFGVDHVLRTLQPTHFLILGLLAIPLGEVVAYNLVALSSYVLSATFTYLLANRFTRSKVASFFAGLVFAFSAYATIHTQQDMELAPQWVIPLFLLALFNLQRRQTWTAAVMLGLAFALCSYIPTYYGYFVSIASLVFVLVESAVRWRTEGWKAILDARRWLLYALAAVIGVGLYLPEAARVLHDLRYDIPSPLRNYTPLDRNDTWYFYMASRPWSFFLPPETHPLLGGPSRALTRKIADIQRLDFSPPLLAGYDLGLYWFWYSAYPVYNELYLGYVNLALAGYAICQASKGAFGKISARPNGKHFALFFFALLFIVALLFSAPPYLPVGALLRPIWQPLHKIVIPMPSLLTMTFALPFRATGRFVALAMLALAMLVALGLERLLERPGSRTGRIALVAVLLGVLVFEYVHTPHTTPADVPHEYRWLAEQPRDTIVAVYPYNDLRLTSFQRVHERPLVNSLTWIWDNLYQIEAQTIDAPNRPDFAPKLAALGTRYVINGGDRWGAPPEGLSLLFTTDTAQVFEVTADPAPLVVIHTLRDGLWTSDAAWAWQGDVYTIYLWNPLNEAATVDIELTLAGQEAGGELLATFGLLPPPRTVIRDGAVTHNPVIVHDYPPGPVKARPVAGGLAFQALSIQPGETTLILRWSGVSPGDPYPNVTDIRFTPDLPALEAR